MIIEVKYLLFSFYNKLFYTCGFIIPSVNYFCLKYFHTFFSTYRISRRLYCVYRRKTWRHEIKYIILSERKTAKSPFTLSLINDRMMLRLAKKQENLWSSAMQDMSRYQSILFFSFNLHNPERWSIWTLYY